jgi:iron complex outermembrane receptor protein
MTIRFSGEAMFRSRSARSIVPFLFAFFVVLAATAAAQSAPTGNITGVVKDSHGGVVPGAGIKVINETTSATAEAFTNGDGAYQVRPLVPGAYRVEASLSGFETAVQRVALASEPAIVNLIIQPSRLSESVVVTARRVEEIAQDVPIPVSVIKGDVVNDAGAFNVNRMKEMLPTVQFYSTNPRNSAINIRGLGAPFGLTNDGIEQGVGMYIDGVYYARPASAALDFLDVDRVEVLRGPQGTLFGKNTTAGAINVTSRKPSFTPGVEAEINLGDLDFVQAKASVTGRLLQDVAGRVSFSGTTRQGTILNTRSRDLVNDLNNVGVRGQILFAPSSALALTVTIDDTRQRVTGNTQVIASVAPTLRPANRQWAQIISGLHYTPPSYNAFDRLTDVDSPLQSYQDLGGASVNVDWNVGRGQLTSSTGWRYWNWDPSSDRDFIGLPVTTVSAAYSKQQQWTQEVRYAGNLPRHSSFVAGAFVFNQSLDSAPAFRQEQGSAAARFLLAPTAAALTPGLLDGYGYNQYVTYDNISAALFGQLQWSIGDRLRLLPGVRLNYDHKKVDFQQQVYGGLPTNDPALIALKNSIFAPQAYKTSVGDTNTSGQMSAAYKVTNAVNLYGTFATSFKSVGLNLNGLPSDAANQPILSAATVKPENVHHVEVGVKTQPLRNLTVNVAGYNTNIKDYQAQVVNGAVGVLRGYLANADKARVRGLEVDTSATLFRHLSIYAAAAFTDGRYISFPDAPPPIEETGGPPAKDISGSLLPGISKTAVSFGGEYAVRGAVWKRSGEFFGAFDTSYRSRFSSSPTESQYMFVDGYTLLNLRVGFRAAAGWTVSLWSRNLLDTHYFDLLTAQPGNTGLIVGQPGEPRTFGVTVRFAIKGR